MRSCPYRRRQLLPAVAPPLLLLIGAVSAAAVREWRPPSSPSLLLWNATVIDGRGGPPEPGLAVLVRDGRIVAVGPSDQVSLPPGGRRVDLSGQYLMPGLIDSHVHLPPNRDSTEAALERLFARGVTTVRDLAGDASLYADLAPRTRDAASTLPRLYYSAFFAGPSWYAADPRPRGATGARAPGEVPWFLAVNDSTDLAHAVANARAIGASAIKVYSDLSLPLVQRIAAEAHRQGLLVWSHPAVFPTRPSDVIAAGADVVSHAALLVWEAVDSLPPRFHTEPWNFFGPVGPYETVAPDAPAVQRTLALMKARGTVLDATVSTIEEGISPAAARWACQVTAAAHRMGIAVSTGTDRATSTRDGRPMVLEEMRYLVTHCGFTPLEAITAATRDGARAIGLGTELGTVEPGRIADLLVLRADPTTDLENTGAVASIIKAGEIHPPQAR